MLDAGIKAKVATLQFSGVTGQGEKNFDYGTILVPMGIQDDEMEVHRIMNQIASEDHIKVYGLNTGLSTRGIDLGSNNFSNVTKPSVAVVGGDGTNSYEVGEMWHLLDQRYHMAANHFGPK